MTKRKQSAASEWLLKSLTIRAGKYAAQAKSAVRDGQYLPIISTNAAFIQELSMLCIDQQGQIDALRKDVQALKGKIK
jgi:hypothetical protein